MVDLGREIMEQSAAKDFTRRISQASGTEIVVVMYDIILKDLETAEIRLGEGNVEAFEKELKHAGKFVTELLASLDLRLQLSYELRRLYLFIQKEMITALIRKSLIPFEAVKSVILPLRSAFSEVSKQDKTGPVMKNVQQLYAGLTYGKRSLNEVILNGDEQSRGFLA